MADAFCCAGSPGNSLSKSEFFLDEDEVLYRRQNSGKYQLVLSSTLVEHIVKFVAHLGMMRSFDLTSCITGGRKYAKI